MRLAETYRRSMLAVCAALMVVACSKSDDGPSGGDAENGSPAVLIETNKGTIEVQLDPEKAPKSVENFLAYIDQGFYDGTIFHRVIPDFMVQGGGYDANLERKETRAPVENEANNGLKNETGTIAMARTSDPHSATSQFFINVKDNAFLDFKAETAQGWGYAVFGKVTGGMDVVRAIEHAETSDRGGAFRNLPTDQVVIESVKRK